MYAPLQLVRRMPMDDVVILDVDESTIESPHVDDLLSMPPNVQHLFCLLDTHVFFPFVFTCGWSYIVCNFIRIIICPGFDHH